MSISENIKKRRIELNMSQEDLAFKMGYRTRSTISKIEKGEIGISSSKLNEFSKVLETSIDFLKYGKTAKKENEAIAFILAGGSKSDNKENVPNQFVTVLGKPIIMHILEVYERHPLIDSIYIVCLKEWQDVLFSYCKEYGITKLKGIIEEGKSGVLSIKNGLDSLNVKPNTTIVLQEATRPLVSHEMISKLLKEKGDAKAICEPMNDKVMFFKRDKLEYVKRDRLFDLQSPEAYKLSMILGVFDKAKELNHELSESCISLLMYNLGYDLTFVPGNHLNPKIVRNEDITIITALLKEKRK